MKTCQDISAAGRRGGLIRYGNGSNRSGLWAHMAQAIDKLRPSLVVAENVRGLTFAKADTDPELLNCVNCVAHARDQSMRALGAVLGDLAGIGYDAAWHGLRASDAGAPHQRFRIFVIAWPADTGGPGLEGTEQPESDRADQERRSPAEIAGRRRTAGRDRSADGLTYFPTPDIGMGSRGTRDPERAAAGRANSTPENRTDRTVTLNDAVSLLPTPDAKLAGSGPDYARMTREGSGGHDLTTALYLLNKANEGALLPTPAAGNFNDREDLDTWNERRRLAKERLGNGNGFGTPLSIAVRAVLPTPSVASATGGQTFLPTPRATEGVNGGPNQRGSSGDLTMSSAVHRDWGIYTAAIQRWEALTRPAPPPTQIGSRGGNRLSPAFVEWMMGLSPGHVTDPAIGISRTEQLTVLGNGVVPQQAEMALRHLFSAVTS